ncbi:MAG TPA: CsbD family protein [Candidatus Saccharimonadales bacterium]
MSSTSDKISGKTKQAVGKMTDNKKLEAKGKVEETKGEMKSKIKHVGDKLAD